MPRYTHTASNNQHFTYPLLLHCTPGLCVMAGISSGVENQGSTVTVFKWWVRETGDQWAV
jgi:hypothetical protein